MPKSDCPQCGCGDIQILKTHTYCPDCNFSQEGELEGERALIPDWVVSCLDATPDLLRDIKEINHGKYGPGYQAVVELPKEVEKTPVRKISWKRPDRVAAAKQLVHARGVQLPARLPMRLPVNF